MVQVLGVARKTGSSWELLSTARQNDVAAKLLTARPRSRSLGTNRAGLHPMARKSLDSESDSLAKLPGESASKMKASSYPTAHLATLGAILAFAPVHSCPANTTNLTSVADTTLQEAFPANNFGGGETFTAGVRLQGGITRALQQFDIAGAIPAGVTVNSVSLTLTVTAVGTNSSTFDLHRVLATWGEGSGSDFGGSPALDGEATWNDRLATNTHWTGAGGDFSPTVSAAQAITSAGDYTFTSAALAADVQAWLNNPATNFGWLLRSEQESTLATIRRFAGRADTNNPPLLTIQYTVPNPPAPPNLFNLAKVGNQIRFSFNGESGRTYAVLLSDSLTNGDCCVLTNIPALSANATLHITNDISSGPRYFRVRTPW